MYIYKEPTQPPLVELDINQKPTAEQLAGWVGNRMLLPYIGQEYRNYSFDIAYRPVSPPSSPATSLYSFLPLGTGIYGGMIDLTGGVVYSWFDSDGNYLSEPEERTFSWKSGASSADPSDYTEGPLPNEIQYQEGYLIFVIENWKTSGYGNYGILRFVTQSEEVEMNIITGYRGQPHITAAQDRAQNQGCFGENSYILDVGSKLAATAYSATEIHIADGVLSHQGCVGVIDSGTYDVVEIDGGTQGYKRKDLIVCRYEKDSNTYEESLTIMAIKGTPTTGSTPATPSYISGDIQGGDLVADMPLFGVLIEGVAISSITQVASGVKTQAELDAAVAAAEARLAELGDFARVAYDSNESTSDKTYNHTVTAGSYLVIVARANSTNSAQNGLYLIRAHSSSSSVLAVASSSVATVSVSGLTISVRLQSTYSVAYVFRI